MIPNIFYNQTHCNEDYFSYSLAYLLNLFPDIGQRLLIRIASLSGKPADYFGKFISCEFIGHEFQESHFESKPDLKIICSKRVLYFENKLESPLNLSQMEKHSKLVSDLPNANIIFVSNIQHDSKDLRKLPKYIHPIISDHYIWTDFIPVFNRSTRKGGLSEKILNDFQMALKANGLIGRVIKGAKDNLYTSGSDSSHIALLQLWDEMHKIGYKLTKKIRRENTIRAYPVKHQVYPLLNPRFRTSAIYYGNNFDKEFLQIVVYTKGNTTRLREKLHNFRSSEKLIFFEFSGSVNSSDQYIYMGSFFIPLTFKQTGKYCEINFEPLRKPLETILKIWQE